MKNMQEIVIELETAKKRIAELDSLQYAASVTIHDLRNTVEDLKKNWRLIDLASANTKREQAELSLKIMQDFLDKQGKFINPVDGEVRIPTPHARVWYFGTDDVATYPFSQVAAK